MAAKQGDTAPSLEVQLVSADGTPVDMTGVNRADFRLYSDTSPRVAKTIGVCALVAPITNGVVRYHWTPTDMDTAGNYLIEVRLGYAAGGYEIVPEENFIRLNVAEALDES